MYVIREVSTTVDVLSPQGILLRQWSTPNKQDTLQYRGIAVDGQGRVFVSVIRHFGASGGNRVLVFTNTGKQLAVWGNGSKDVAGEPVYLEDPEGLALDAQGDLYVADSGGHLIVKFSPSGQVLARLPLPSPTDDQGTTAFWPWAVAVDGQGNVYADYEYAVVKLSPTGRVIAGWGKEGNVPGQFESAAGMAIDARGELYVADSSNDRIQKLSPG
jgi:DNA-binding beta-propeller fold protein YncE